MVTESYTWRESVLMLMIAASVWIYKVFKMHSIIAFLSALSSIIAPPFINNERNILKPYDTIITENFCEFKQMYFKSLFSISI